MASKQFKLDKQLLKSFEPFRDLATDKLDELAAKSLLEDLPAGRTVFRQGERDKRLLFLVAGQIELNATDGKKSNLIKANTGDSSRPLCDTFPRPYTGKTKGNATLLTVDADLLEIILDDTPPDAYQVEVTEIDGDDTTDWMLRFLQSRAFLKLPTDNIQAVLMRMEEVPGNKGEIVIRQGEKDDYYYIVQSGECAVMRRPAPKAEEVQIATLKEGDGFGEEALITNGKRNASIKMLQDGVLMRINKRDFLEYLAKPLINQISGDEATSKLNAGSLLIDVRRHEEFAKDSINGAVNIPLSMLRLKTAGLNPSREYILLCDDGNRSAAAAFLMTQLGLNVSVLQGGLAAGELKVPDSKQATAPQTAPETKRTQAADKTKQAAEHRAKKISQEADTARHEAEKLAKQNADAEAARRKAKEELQRLQELEKKRQQAAKKDLEKQSARANVIEQQAEVMKKQAEEAQLKAEAHLKKIANARKANEQKQKLLEDSLKRAKNISNEAAKAAEDARRQAEKEAEEIRLQAMAEAEKLRLEMEKTRQQLEQQSQRSQAEEQAALEQARKQAEETVKQTAEQARREAEAIRRQALEDAEKLKAEMQATRMQVEQEVSKAEEAERQKRLEILEQTRMRAEELAQKTAQQAETEAEEIRRQAIEEAEQLRAELENTRKLLAEQALRSKAEEEARSRLELEEQARRDAEQKIKLEAEAKQQARRDAEQQLRLEAEAKERARLEAEEQARREAEQQEQDQLEAERQRRRKQAIKNAQMKKKEQARKMAEEIKAKLEQAEKARQEEEARQRGDGISLANATVKRSQGKIVLEGDEDIFIFKEPTIKVEDIEAELKKLEVIEEKDELPSFEVEEEQKPVFAPVNTQAISLKLEQQASDNKQQRKKRHIMALAASLVLAIGGGVSYMVMNPALLDSVMMAKAKPAASSTTAKASISKKLPDKSKLEKIAKQQQEKKEKSAAQSRFEQLLSEWKQLTSSSKE